MILRTRHKSALIGLITGFANGLFGAGGGMLLVPAMERYLDVAVQKAHATAIAVMLPLSVVSAFVYMRAEMPRWDMLLWISTGGMLGGFIGAKFLRKIPNGKLSKLFSLFIIAAAVRMIL